MVTLQTRVLSGASRHRFLAVAQPVMFAHASAQEHFDLKLHLPGRT